MYVSTYIYICIIARCNFRSPTLSQSHHPAALLPCPTCAQRSSKADCACAKPDQRAQRAPSTAEDNLQEIHRANVQMSSMDLD